MSYKKQQIGSENKAFNPEWINKYLVMCMKDKILCLVFREALSVLNEYNIRRRFEATNPNLAKLDDSER
jgi:hypothetical protein